MMAQTVDGIIAKNNEHFPDWTCSADKRLFKRVTTEAGVLIMGSRTYRTIGKALSGRLNIVYTRHPDLMPVVENVRFVEMHPKKLIEELEVEGYQKVILTGGAEINSLFLKAKLIDELLVTISPRLFGRGLSIFHDPTDLDLELIDHSKIDAHTLLLHYRIIYDRQVQNISEGFVTV
jgi:dihydrofolate reductase